MNLNFENSALKSAHLPDKIGINTLILYPVYKKYRIIFRTGTIGGLDWRCLMCTEYEYVKITSGSTFGVMDNYRIPSTDQWWHFTFT